MIEAIKKIKHKHNRITIVLNELEILEDENNPVYEDILFELRWITNELEYRRETLQKRGRCL